METETIDKLFLELSQFTTARTSKELSQDTEKRRRVYYQDLVYHVCNAIDRFYSTRTACGTVDEPSTQLQERLKETLRMAFGHTVRQQTVKLAERGYVGVWCWGGDEHDHPESLMCPILISPGQMRVLINDREAARRDLAQSTNYVCDTECRPTQVTFNNGRIVRLAFDDDGPYLEVTMREPSESEKRNQ